MSSRKDKMVETLAKGKAFLEAEKKKKLDMKSNAEVLAKGKRLLEAARKDEYKKVIQLMTKEPLPNVDFVDEYNVTPLTYLLAAHPSPPESSGDHFKAVYLLISKGANGDSANDFFRKPLSLLASSYFPFDTKIFLITLMIKMNGGNLKLSSADFNCILLSLGLTDTTTMYNDLPLLLQNSIAIDRVFCVRSDKIKNLLDFWKKRSPHGMFQPTFADVVHKNGSIDTSETQEFRLKHKNGILNECQEMANQKAIFYYRFFRSKNRTVSSNLMTIILRFDGFYKDYLDNHDSKDETPEIRKAIDDYIQKILLKASKSVKMQEAFSASQQRHLQSMPSSIKFPTQLPIQLPMQLPMQNAFPLQFSNNPFAQSKRSSSSSSASSSSSSAGNLWKRDKVNVEESLQGLQPPLKKRRIEKP